MAAADSPLKIAISEFALVPVTDVSRRCVVDAAVADGTKVSIVPLLQGTNYLGKLASVRGRASCYPNQLSLASLGIPGDAKGVREKHVVLSTTNAPVGAVLLNAFGTIRIQGRSGSKRAGATPTKRSPSRKSGKTGVKGGSPSSSTAADSLLQQQSRPCTTLKAGSQRYLLTGETLELDAEKSTPAYAYTLVKSSTPLSPAVSPRTSRAREGGGHLAPRSSNIGTSAGGRKRPRSQSSGIGLAGLKPAAPSTSRELLPSVERPPSSRCSLVDVAPTPPPGPLARAHSLESPNGGHAKRRLNLGPTTAEAAIVVVDDSDEDGTSTKEGLRLPPPSLGEENRKPTNGTQPDPVVEEVTLGGAGAGRVLEERKGEEAKSRRRTRRRSRSSIGSDSSTSSNPSINRPYVLDLTDDSGLSLVEPVNLCESDDDGANDGSAYDRRGIRDERIAGKLPTDSSLDMALAESRSCETTAFTNPSLRKPSKHSGTNLTFLRAEGRQAKPRVDSRIPSTPSTPFSTSSWKASSVGDTAGPKVSSPVESHATQETSWALMPHRLMSGKRRSVDASVRTRLVATVGHGPNDTVLVVEELLARGMAPPSGLCDAVVAALLNSGCDMRTQCLQRQLRAMLAASRDCWAPQVHESSSLENVMLGIIGRNTKDINSDKKARKKASRSSPTPAMAPAVLQAHIAVLEVLLDFLVEARCANHARTAISDGGSKATAAAHIETLRLLFDWSPERKKMNPETALWNAARRAVKKCTAWAVQTWTLGAALGSGGDAVASDEDELCGLRTSAHGEGSKSAGKRSKAQATACVLTARLLGEVVEMCGLPSAMARDAIREEIGMHRCAQVFGGNVERAAVARHLEADASALCGLMRALSGRDFVRDLAQNLHRDLLTGGQTLRTEASRLESLLMRQAKGGGIGLIERFSSIKLS